MDQFYVDSGYWDITYTGYLADVVADLPSVSSLTADAIKIKIVEISADINASFSTSIIIGKVYDVGIALSGYYEDEYYDSEYFNYYGAYSELSCTGEIALSGSIVEASGDWNSTYFVDVQSSRIVSESIALSCSSSMSTTISHIQGADLFAFSDAMLAIEADRIRDNNIETTSAFDITTNASRLLIISANAPSETFVSTAGQRVRYYEAASDAAFALSFDALRVKEIESSQNAAFALTSEASKIQPLTANINSESALDTTIGKIVQASSFVNSAFVPTLSVSVTKNSFAVLDTSSSLATTARVIVSRSASMQSNASLFTTATVLRKSINCNLISNFSISATALDLDLTNASLSGTFSTQSTAKKIARLRNQNISSAFTISANVNENPNPNPTIFVGQGFQLSANFRSSNSSSGIVIDLTGQSQTLVSGVYTPPIKAYLYNGPVVGGNYDYLKIYMPVIWRDPSDGKLYNLTSTVVYRIPTAETSALANGTTRSIVFNCPDIQNIGSIDIPHETVASGFASVDSNNFTDGEISWGYGKIYYPNIQLTIDGITKTWDYVLFCDSKNLLPIGFRPHPSGSMINGQTGTYTYSSGTSNAVFSLYTPSYQLGTWVIASADLPTISSLSSSLTRAVLFQSAINSNFTQSTTGLRLKKSPVALQSITTQTVIGQKNAILNSSISANIILASSISRKRPGNSQLQATASQTTNATKAVITASHASAQASLTANNSRTRETTAIASATATMNCNAIKISRASSIFNAWVTEISVVNKIGRDFIHADVYSAMQVQAKVTTDTPIVLAADTNLTTSVTTVLFAESHLQVTTNLSITNDYLRRNESIQSVETNLDVVNERIRYNSAGVTAQASLTADTLQSKTVHASSAQTATTSIEINNQVVRLAQANLYVEAKIPFALAGIMVRYEAHLIAEGFVLTAGQILHIDPYYQLKIEPEHRGLIITQEHRVITIEQETRVNKISGYKL